MSFPPCPGCGATYAPGDIGTVHLPDCPALRGSMSEDRGKDWPPRLPRADEPMEPYYNPRDQLDRLEKKLDWLHWAIMNDFTPSLHNAKTAQSMTTGTISKPASARPWPGDVP